MKTAALTALVLVVLLGGGAPRSQEISTDIFPSEDEIYEALRSGEISYQQYLILQEIAANGIDSTNRHLLDEIPNLSFFSRDTLSLATTLENEQETPFEASRELADSKPTVTGRFNQSLAAYADESSRSRSATGVNFRIGEAVSADIRIRRDYNNREYFAARSVTFRSGGVVREAVLGNFSRRYGLGTVFGHRGKLFSTSYDLNSNSFLFPEHGGGNGAAVLLSFGKFQLRGFGSVMRSDYTRLSSCGGMVQASGFFLKPAFIAGTTRLKNRTTGESIEDTKFAVTARHDYRRGYTAAEACWQVGESNALVALVTEGRHRFKKAEIKYAGWMYDDGYVDLAAGSKAAAMYHMQVFESVDRDYSTRRTGQQGLLVKTIVDLTDKIELANSLLYASFNADTVNTQWLAQASRKFGRLSLGVDFLSRGQTRSQDSITRRQIRLVARWRAKRLYLRTCAGYNAVTSERDFLSLLANLKYNLDSHCRIELWLNISEIQCGEGRINRCYAYARSSMSVAGSMTLGMKMSHTYNYASSTVHRTIVGCDLSCCF